MRDGEPGRWCWLLRMWSLVCCLQRSGILPYRVVGLRGCLRGRRYIRVGFCDTVTYHSRDVLPSQWRSAKDRAKEGDQHAALSARSRRTPRGLGRPDALSAQLAHLGECGDGQASGRAAVWPSSGSLRRGCSAPPIGRANNPLSDEAASLSRGQLAHLCVRSGLGAAAAARARR